MRRGGLEFKAGIIREIGIFELREWLDNYMSDKWPRRLSIEKRKEWLDKISEYILDACEKIEREYGDDPDNIFAVNNGHLSIHLVYFLLRQFKGISPKKLQ